MMQAPFQSTHIPVTQSIKVSLESMMKALEYPGDFLARLMRQLLSALRTEEIQNQRRHKRPRKEVRGQHGEHHRFGQRTEQITRNSTKEENRHEDDTDGESGDESRGGNLLCARENRCQRSGFYPRAANG